jgi:uncharacterized protein YceK
MRNIILLLSAMLILSACSSKDQQAESANYATPQAAVIAFVKAMNTQDSVTMINLLSQTTREQVVSKVGELGGFTSLFKYTKGMKMEMTIAGVDSTSEKFTKIYTNQRIIKDTSVLMNLDSMYFSAVNEEGSWKLLNLNARPDEKKLNP